MHQEPSTGKSGLACNLVIKKDGRYLLVQEKKKVAYGLWNLPGGRVDEGETLEETAVREAKEETGFNIRLTRQLIVVHKDVKHNVLHAYEANIIGGSLAFPEDEILDAKWFTYDEILAIKDKLRHVDYTLDAIEASRNQ